MAGCENKECIQWPAAVELALVCPGTTEPYPGLWYITYHGARITSIIYCPWCGFKLIELPEENK